MYRVKKRDVCFKKLSATWGSNLQLGRDFYSIIHVTKDGEYCINI